jgi:hypothetical protein
MVRTRAIDPYQTLQFNQRAIHSVPLLPTYSLHREPIDQLQTQRQTTIQNTKKRIQIKPSFYSYRQPPINLTQHQATLYKLLPPVQVIPILDRHALRHMIHLVNTDQTFRELEHVISEGDDDELCVFCSLFDVRCYDRDLKERIVSIRSSSRFQCPWLRVAKGR